MLSDNQIETHLAYLEDQLLKSKKDRIELSHGWANLYPSSPGIYIAFEESKVVYVGETGKVSGRMRDLLDSRHHTLRRNIGKMHFSKKQGYKDATTKSKFPSHIEQLVDKWLTGKIEISVMSVKLGRKELEERIIKKCSPKYNMKGERKTK